jgi:peptidyl-prolyl cis-trans isomerase SurA
MRRALVGTCLVLLLLAPPAAADEVLVDGIAAQVGTEIVLVSEVMQLVADQEPRMRAAGAQDADIAAVRAEALETVIEWRLIEQMVANAELFATDAEIDTTIDAIARENNLSIAKLKRDLASQGMTWEGYRAEIKRELERRKVLNAVVAARVQVEEEEVEQLYQDRFADQPDTGTTVHLRQILVPGGEDAALTVEDACRLVRMAREKVAGGDSFQELAARMSAVAPQQGGDLGWLHIDTVAGYLRELIAPLQPGDLSPVQELPIGCTLVQLVDRKEWRPVSFEEAKASLQSEIFERKMMEEYRDWMDEMRDQTFIERRGYFADAAKFERSSSPGGEFEAGMSDISVLGNGAAGDESTQ